MEVPLVVVQDPALINHGTATWTYTIADGAFDFLAAGEILTLTYFAQVDNNFALNSESKVKSFTITITGTNDKPTIATAGGTVIERVGTGNTAVDTTTGTVTFTDADLSDRPIVSAALSTSEPFRYLDAQGHDVTGGLTAQQLAAIAAVEVPLGVVQSAGNTHNGSATWTYSIVDHSFDFIANGETLILNYVVQVDDGHGGVVATPISISINGADVTVVGTNDVPTIVTASTTPTGAVTEDAASTLTADGTITFQDLDLTDTHTASFVLKSSDAGANLPGFSEAAPLSQIGTFALTAVNENPAVTTIGSFGWSFALPDSDPVLQSLAAGQTITQVYTVTIKDNNNAPVSQDVTITITGTNDDPVITSLAGDHAGAVTEDDVASGNLVASDTITFRDVDLIDTHTATFVLKSSDAAADLPGFSEGTGTDVANIGTFAIDATVTEDNTDTVYTGSLGWSFTLANDDPVLQSLAAGQTITQVYTVTIKDNNNAPVSQDVTITITGTNDDPVITSLAGDHAGAVTEDDVASGNLVASDTITFRDVDLIDTHTATFVLKSSDAAADLPGFSEGTGTDVANIGTFAIDATVTEDNTDTVNTGSLGWSFTLANDDPVLQSLAAGQTITQVYTVTIKDNNDAPVSQDVTITITGTNDDPVVAAALFDSVNEGDLAFTQNLLSGASDVDNGETETLYVASVSYAVGSAAGSATAPAGVSLDGYTLTVDPTDHAFDYLAVGQQTTIVVSYDVTDAQGATVAQTETITITGTNDAPTVAAVLSYSVNEGDPAFSKNLLSGASDIDDGETATLYVASVSYAVGSAAGSATAPAGVSLDGYTLTVDPTDHAFDYLAVGQQTTIVVSYGVTDAQGATVAQTETITITGTNDDPVVAAALFDSVNEGDLAFTQNLLSGASDVDNGETETLYVASVSYAVGSAAGSATAPAGVSLDGYTLTVDPTDHAFDYLAVGQQTTIVVSYDVTDAQGATVAQTETITITGTNDAATITGKLAGHVVEDAITTVDSAQYVMYDSGVVTVNDADDGEAHFQDPASLAGTYGTFTFNGTSGAWTYQADPAKVQWLGPDTTATDTLTVTSADGTEHQDIVVTIEGSNDAPDYSGKGFSPTYHAADEPVAIVHDVSASDIDSADYAGGSLTATVTDGGHEGDTLSIVANQYISLTIASGTTVMYDSDSVGGADPFAIGTLSNYDYNSLTVTLNDHASNAAVAALTEAIEFSNSKPDAIAGDRTVTFTLRDGDGTANNGHDSNYFDAHVTVAEGAVTGPVIHTDQFVVSEEGYGVTTVSGLYVTDTDTSAEDNDGFTLLAATGAPEPAQSSVDPTSSSGYLSDINDTLSNGVTYNPGEINQPLTDSVTFTVDDGLGHSDTVNFIFNQAGEGGATLTGTDGKDVIFSTGNADTLTGRGGADQFVFKVGDGHDTITDFTTGRTISTSGHFPNSSIPIRSGHGLPIPAMSARQIPPTF